MVSVGESQQTMFTSYPRKVQDMKVIILAGGRGTRLGHETDRIPKPMVEIGGKPILWHIMKHYAHYGFSEFVVAGGYQVDIIKHYIWDRGWNSDSGVYQVDENFDVQVIDTGLDTQTGERIKRLQPLIDDTFMVTYGDGVSNVKLDNLIAYHGTHPYTATMTAVRPPSKFGVPKINELGFVEEFAEKPRGWINGGFFVFEPSLFEYLEDGASLEQHTLSTLAREGQLLAYNHYDFWQCMDTPHDRDKLRELWDSGNAPWRIWE